MTGVKGRSGRAKNLDGIKDKVRAAKARWAQEIPPPRDPEVEASIAGDELITIEQHDKLLGKPMTYGDALKRLQLVEQHTINQRRAEELAQVRFDNAERRGLYVERKEMDRMAGRIRDAWWQEVQQVAGLALARLADLPGEARVRVKQAIADEIAAAAERVRTSLLA